MPERRLAMFQLAHCQSFVNNRYFSIRIYDISLSFSGGKDPPANNWQRIVLDIPNDKLILSLKEARPSYMPTRIQALVIVRQRLNGR